MTSTSELLAMAREDFKRGSVSHALPTFLDLAESGEVEGLMYVGRIVLLQQIDASSLSRAMALFSRNGETSDHLFFLGVVYERSGENFKAAETYRKAVVLGSIPASYQLALLLRRVPSLSLGPGDDMESWLLLSAEKGHVYAKGLIAKIRLAGGIPSLVLQGLWDLIEVIVSVFAIVLAESNKKDPFADSRLWKVNKVAP